jgi:predicted GIY-YIG superfamily endonuclease
MAFQVYMMANRRNGAVYVGSTDDLAVRVWQIEETNPSWADLYETLNG